MPEDDDFKENLNNEENLKDDVPAAKKPEPESFSADTISETTADVQPEAPSKAVFPEETPPIGASSKDVTAQGSETEDSTVTVQPVQFASFEDLDQVQGPQNQNLNILLDIKLQLTVELGRTELPIKKVLELTKGSIVTLNKAAGEPVELYANGKLIAYGEVVVIEDNFGLRITHITDPAKRLNSLGTNTPPEG